MIRESVKDKPPARIASFTELATMDAGGRRDWSGQRESNSLFLTPLLPTLAGIIGSGFEDFRLLYDQIRSPGTALPAPTSKSVLSGHRVLNFESETLSGDSCWIGEKRLIDRGQREFGTALCEQHLASACANGTVFRKPR